MLRFPISSKTWSFPSSLNESSNRSRSARTALPASASGRCSSPDKRRCTGRCGCWTSQPGPLHYSTPHQVRGRPSDTGSHAAGKDAAGDNRGGPGSHAAWESIASVRGRRPQSAEIQLRHPRSYQELLGAKLAVASPAVPKDLQIIAAAQNTRFQMDEKGVKLRSESHVSFGCGGKPGHPGNASWCSTSHF